MLDPNNNQAGLDMTIIRITLGLMLLGGWSSGWSDEVRVAVATNFIGTLEQLISPFESNSGDTVVAMPGSTGKHFAQIVNGAPVDVFLAADQARPIRLEAGGYAIPSSRFTYAIGQLVLWSPQEDFIDPDGRRLSLGGFRHLAIANPKLAPYGRAAKETLEALQLWDDVQTALVRGENIGQAFQFVSTGNAELGFVAASQIPDPAGSARGSWWVVPGEFYSPIEQQAVLLTDSPAARAFVEFLKADEARAIIRRYGYTTP